MKVFVEAFLSHNLGDDLFLQILSNRYKNVKFYAISYDKYKSLQNVKIYSGKIVKYLDLLIKLVSNKKNNIINYLGRFFDVNILIGGSMFMETNELQNYDTFKKRLEYKAKNKNTYILGVNFGPFFSEEYYLEYKKYFGKVKDVCFRDDSSYQLFNELSNVRKAPDIVFSLDTNNLNMTSEKMIVVSVINLSDKENLKKYENQYINLMGEIIKYYKDYKIVLMSFCENDMDYEMVKKIKDKYSEFNLQEYTYKDNISEALELIARCEVVIGSRFHANILGLLFQKKIIPFAYSDKTINFLDSIGYNGMVLDIRNLNNVNIKDVICNNTKINFDINKIKMESEQHFKELDKILIGGGNSDK